MCCYSPDMLYRTFRGFGRKYPIWKGRYWGCPGGGGRSAFGALQAAWVEDDMEKRQEIGAIVEAGSQLAWDGVHWCWRMP